MSSNPEARDSRARFHVASPGRAEVDQVWRQFGSAGTPEEFCQSWLALQCHIISQVNDGVVVLQKPGGDSFAPLAFWPEGRSDRSRLAAITERALREGRGIVQPLEPGETAAEAGEAGYQLAYPVRLDGAVRGVVALDIAGRPEAQLQIAMRQLQWGSGWLEVLLRRHADPAEAARLRLRLILQFVASFLEGRDLRDSASALVTELASQLGCDRVCLGLLEGGRIALEAVSHAARFDPHANLLRATEAAMTEALDQREPVIYPPQREGRLTVSLSHAELAQLSGAGGIATYPLVSGGRQLGALTLERAPGFAFDPPATELLEGLAAMLGPLVEMRRSQHRSLPRHAAESARGFWERLAGPGHSGLKLGAAGIAVLAAFLALATGGYRIPADTRLEGMVQRAVTAPFQGYVREAAHRAGDTVKSGEVLARLDDRDLRVERVRLIAQRDQLGNRYREAMANRDRAQVAVVSAQIEQAEAQLALVEQQLTRTEIVAPFDGVIVSGDLTQSLGAPLERGQVLFEIAPLDDYRVILRVDERDVADIRVGQRGDLVLSSMPGQSFPVRVSKITPVSTASEGRNFFRVEAALEGNAGGRLRPGMEGVAKIHVEDRHLAWIWTRESLNWIRLTLWRLLP
jgi:RND family efflux transporter MFP subunit